MRSALLAAAVGFSWFLLVNLAVSAAIALVLGVRLSWRAAPPRVGGAVWLLLRIAPSATALLVVGIAVAPAHFRFEPPNIVEPFGPWLSLLGAASAGLVAWTFLRAVAAWLRARALERTWMRTAAPLAVAGAPVPVYRVERDVAGVTLAGIWRPRLFVTRSVADTLTAEELEVVVAHEAGHRAGWDNLKRLILLASPDALGLTPFGRYVSSEWVTAAETAADAHAVGRDPLRGLTLASALVKVARMLPVPSRRLLPMSTLNEGGPLAARVRRLTGVPPAPASGWPLAWAAVAAMVIAALGTFSLDPAWLLPIHHATEWLVRLSS
jgi:beta-lactamase regulating signal transducer with metallopeptidase domain